MRGLIRLLYHVLLILLFLGVFFLALKNQHLVPLDGFTTEQQLPLAWLLLMTWFAGVVMALLACLPYFWRRQRPPSTPAPTSHRDL